MNNENNNENSNQWRQWNEINEMKIINHETNVITLKMASDDQWLIKWRGRGKYLDNGINGVM